MQTHSPASSLQQWQNTGHYFQYREHRIFFQDSASNKPTLLCIHGFPTASWDWYKLWPTLSTLFRVVTLDMIGFGFSDKPRDYHYSILDQADLYTAFLKHLNIQSVHILAHDYGDTVTQELMARQQQNPEFDIHSVCLLNGGLFPEVHRPRLVQTLLKSPIGKYLAPLLNEQRVSRSLRDVFAEKTQPSHQELQEFWQLINYNNGIKIFYKLIEYMNERVQHRQRWVGALQQASMPVRFINGLDDPISGKHMAERYVELVPNPDVVQLKGIGHYPQIEDDAQVLTALLEFYQAIGIIEPKST